MTPGPTEKRYPAGSLHRRTAQVTPIEEKPKEGLGAALSLRHSDDLRQAFRHD